VLINPRWWCTVALLSVCSVCACDFLIMKTLLSLGEEREAIGVQPKHTHRSLTGVAAQPALHHRHPITLPIWTPSDSSFRVIGKSPVQMILLLLHDTGCNFCPQHDGFTSKVAGGGGGRCAAATSPRSCRCSSKRNLHEPSEDHATGRFHHVRLR
jgi:hypothetical protein